MQCVVRCSYSGILVKQTSRDSMVQPQMYRDQFSFGHGRTKLNQGLDICLHWIAVC